MKGGDSSKIAGKQLLDNNLMLYHWAKKPRDGSWLILILESYYMKLKLNFRNKYRM